MTNDQREALPPVRLTEVLLLTPAPGPLFPLSAGGGNADRFVCPRCGAASSNPTDIQQGYCGRCHDWTGTTLPPGPDLLATTLIRDEPAWTYPAPTGPASRRLRVWDLGLPTPRCLVAVITEAGPGMSITTAAAQIAAALAAEYPDDWLEVIEHWPPGTGSDPAEHYDQVECLPPLRDDPHWRRLDTAALTQTLPGLTLKTGVPPDDTR